MSSHQIISLFLNHPISQVIAAIGGWRLFLRAFSDTTREFEKRRNREAVRLAIRFFKWVGNVTWRFLAFLERQRVAMWRMMTAKPTAGPDSPLGVRVGLWLTAAMDCMYVAWFVVYSTTLILETALSWQASSLTFRHFAAHLALLVIAVSLFPVAGFYRQRALDIRNALIRSN